MKRRGVRNSVDWRQDAKMFSGRQGVGDERARSERQDLKNRAPVIEQAGYLSVASAPGSHYVTDLHVPKGRQ